MDACSQVQYPSVRATTVIAAGLIDLVPEKEAIHLPAGLPENLASTLEPIKAPCCSEPESSIVKACPRCTEVYQKEDEDECGHVKCSLCEFEFCSACLSDRSVIEA